MTTITAGEAAVGTTYNTPTGQPVKIEGRTTPGFTDLRNNLDRVFPVPNSYTLIVPEVDNGIDWRSLVGDPEPKLRPRLRELTQAQLDGLSAADSRVWLQVAIAAELDRRADEAPPEAVKARCECCGADVELRESSTRKVQVFTSHPSADKRRMCAGVSRTPEEAAKLAAGDDDDDLPGDDWRAELSIGDDVRIELYADDRATGDSWPGTITEADDRTVTVAWFGDRWSGPPSEGNGRRMQARFGRRTGVRIGDGGNGTERRLHLVELLAEEGDDTDTDTDEDRDVSTDTTPDTTPDPIKSAISLLYGATTAPERIAKIKTWTAADLAAWDLEQEGDEPWARLYNCPEPQAAVEREIQRHRDALAKLAELDATTPAGRDELLRLRKLRTTQGRSGMVKQIDHVLASTVLADAEDTAAQAAADRLGDEPPIDVPFLVRQHVRSWYGDAVDGPTLFAIAGMVESVRASRKAAAACTDPAAVRCAWLYVALNEEQPTSTVATGLARRYAKLGGGELAVGHVEYDHPDGLPFATEDGVLIAVGPAAIPEDKATDAAWLLAVAHLDGQRGEGDPDPVPAPDPAAKRLDRGTCPACGRDVALRKDGQLREHSAVAGSSVPACEASGLTIEDAAARLDHGHTELEDLIRCPPGLTMSQIVAAYCTGDLTVGKPLEARHLFEIDGHRYTCTGFRADERLAWISPVLEVAGELTVGARRIEVVINVHELDRVSVARALELVAEASGEELAEAYDQAKADKTWRPQVVSAISNRLQRLGWRYAGEWIAPDPVTAAAKALVAGAKVAEITIPGAGAVPLCATCVDCMPQGGVDFDWRPAGVGEACGADDHAENAAAADALDELAERPDLDAIEASLDDEPDHALEGYEAALAGVDADEVPEDPEAAAKWIDGWAQGRDELAKAEALGRAAFADGVAGDACPFDVGSEHRAHWRRGWLDAQNAAAVKAHQAKRAEADAEQTLKQARIPITLDALELVALPDGTRDVWARLPDALGGGKRRLGAATDPGLAPYVAALEDQARAAEASRLAKPTPPPVPKPPAELAPEQLAELGSLGAALLALQRAGIECEITLRVRKPTSGGAR